jgi:putative transposase
VTARGNERRTIFEDAADRRRFLELLAEVCGRFAWRIHAYCLMGNHYHLLFETAEPTLARGMRQLNGIYSQAFNRRRGRAGHLLQGRYHAVLVER